MTPRDAAAEALAALLPILPAVRECPDLQELWVPQVPDSQPADQQLREFFRRHPGLGKRDRQQIGDWIFEVLRNLRLYTHLCRVRRGAGAGPLPQPGDAVRGLIATAIESTAAAAGGGPGAVAAADLPEPVRYSLPDWLWARLQAGHGARAGPIAGALLQAAPIDLRANLLVGKAQVLRRKLAEAGVEAAVIAGVPTGLRVAGRPNLEKLDLFERGWFEIQDAGSQRIAAFCDTRRGQLVIDFCAGAGGKSLAMAAAMRNMGKVLALDTSGERLARLKPRAGRAGADIIEALRISGLADPRLGRYRRRADVVLVDAPCSGTGTLRRSPDLKWRSRARLLQYVEEQQAILATAASLVRPGGRLVYATCSLLREENEDQVAVFAQAGFELEQVASWLPDEGPSSGFFAAKWSLKGS